MRSNPELDYEINKYILEQRGVVGQDYALLHFSRLWGKHDEEEIQSILTSLVDEGQLVPLVCKGTGKEYYVAKENIHEMS